MKMIKGQENGIIPFMAELWQYLCGHKFFISLTYDFLLITRNS